MDFDSVYTVIEYIGDHHTSLFDKGTMWEKAVLFYLRNDPSMRRIASEAWLWDDSPTYDGHDTGIDVVCAHDAATAEANGQPRYWAVQCKDYGKKVDLSDLATFWMKSSDEQYAGRMVFSTTDFTDNVRKQAAKDGTILVGPAAMDRSSVDWNALFTDNGRATRDTYDLREHQRDAVRDINAKLESFDRCKAIMACGTGKTLMALRLAEGRCSQGMVLFAAPSIALISQAMREWVNQDRVGLRPLVVCSDATASQVADEDDATISTIADLSFPASTSAHDLVRHYEFVRRRDPDAMVVVFTTYQSMQVIADAQAARLPAFDLAICDEAHRTTGVAETADDVTAFMLVHDESRVHATKRVYMTATPRIYDDKAKARAHEQSVGYISSMDDSERFGPTAYEITFADAVERGLLCDYRVVVLSISEDAVPAYMQDAMFDGEQIPMPDAAKIIGTYKGLVTHGERVQRRLDQAKASIEDATPDFFLIDEVTADELEADGEPGDLEAPDGVEPLRRAVGFCSRIADSKRIDRYFEEVVGRYLEQSGEDLRLRCRLDHVDGSMGSDERAERLHWLASGTDSNECRIVTNARCLAEGVDVPSLDAVIFFAAKKSKVDVIQAVGRVMRTFKGKELGYIILPVFIPAGMDAAQALDNSQTFDVVWQVLQALRSHDDRIDAYVNSLQFRKKKDDDGAGSGGRNVVGKPDADGDDARTGQQTELAFDYGNNDTARAVYAKMVERCGTKIYWESWADDVARVAQLYVDEIRHAIGTDEGSKQGFDRFLEGLRASLNPSIRADEAVEMIAQHMITVPVFDALFSDFEFRNSNPVALAIEEFVARLRSHGVGDDTLSEDDRRQLDDLYASVRRRASIVRTDFGRQELIKDLYNNFFAKAFTRTSEKLGIVYTPGEIVDAQLHLVDRVLRREFGRSLADEGVNVLDPFAGTGSYMARLIEDPTLIPVGKLRHKYLHELHSNEILLLAYYIMVVNIEYAYHSRMGGAYEPYRNALLTDTFQMSEEGDQSDLGMFIDNTERVWDQEALDITVVCSNPPWSAWQRSANDDAQNESYATLDARIASTYVAKTTAVLRSSLYDSYVRAFRWASDRIGREGVVCFVSNAGWLRSDAGAGVRRCFAEEFNSIYVYDFRGNQRTQGEISRMEGGKVFGSGSRAAVAITMLVKTPLSSEHGAIHYCEVGDYKSREEKLDLARQLVNDDPDWQTLVQDKYGDWLDQRDDSFYEFAPIGKLDGHRKTADGVFSTWSNGVKTQRDPWAWNYDSNHVSVNIARLVSNTNEEISRLRGSIDARSNDPKKYSWTRAMRGYAQREELIPFDSGNVLQGLYRPFTTQYVYFESHLNEVQGLQARLFPKVNDNVYATNVVLDAGERGCLATRLIPDLELIHHGQCFPLYWYEKEKDYKLVPAKGEKVVTDVWGNRYVRHDAITDNALAVFREAYPTAFMARKLKDGPKELTKEDIFYYVYGILHSPEYRERFATNLQKELPRIPLAEDFEAFSRAGRALADLHLKYETAEPWAQLECTILPGMDPGPVTKLAWGKKRDPETRRLVPDRTRIVYSKDVIVSNIPTQANDYKVNGRSPLEWMIDRYKVTTDKKTGIMNDPNLYSDDPRYILDLIGRLVTVSMRTLEVIAGLPAMREKGHTSNWPAEWEVHQ
ncbi:MAG: DEAD/DEAH box helicase [Atopobiaceae bacterium]|nr:DEAD/DEAH box helicase [Atopobiaceae bacterium]